MSKSRSRIAWVGPASPMASLSHVESAKQLVESQHPCDIIFGSDCYQPTSIAERSELFLEYANDPSIDGLWAVRGGEGSADIIASLLGKRQQLQNLSHKWLMGFSDITALLFFMREHCQWRTIHGPCVNGFVSGQLEASTLRCVNGLLNQQSHAVIWNDLEPINQSARHCQTIKAPLFAGNLTMIGLGVKDCWELDMRNRIVVVEDVNEAPYAIVRGLKYLARIGTFNSAVGLILGSFTQHQDTQSPIANQDLTSSIKSLKTFAENCDCPVFLSSQIGHGVNNQPIPLGVMAQLDKVGDQTQLSYMLN